MSIYLPSRRRELNKKALVRRFQPGEGPLLHDVIVETDCEPDGSFYSTSNSANISKTLTHPIQGPW